jgi:group I intron endonuclease
MIGDSGIYKIENFNNKNIYVGSAKNFDSRWRYHKRDLRRNCHCNKKLQHSWNKYGEELFIFVKLEIVDDIKMLIEREQYWMDTLKPEYNLAPKAGSNLGIKMSDETRAKMSLDRTGKSHHSEKGKIELGLKMVGNKYAAGKIKIHSQETKDKIAEKIRGTRHSPESYARASKKLKGRPSWNLGIKASEETKKKLRESHLGQISWNKGQTGVSARGVSHGRSKLSETDVLSIRSRSVEGSLILSEIYNVDRVTINRIIRRGSWKHI